MSASTYESLAAAAGPVSRETYEAALRFQNAFLKWAARINLVAPSTFSEVWRRHILDSAQLLPLAPDATRWVDIGSGGGFPGLILGLLLKERAGASIELVESNRKKCGFLQAMAGEFKMPVKVHAKRIEDASASIAVPDIVTARALASLPLLLDLASPWMLKGATALFHKGRGYQSEVAETAHQWRFDLVEHPSRIDPHGVILEIRGLRRA